MDLDEARRRFSRAPVARLATVTPAGAPHIVPVVFVLVDAVVYSAVDDKPKSTTRLQRLANLRHEPRCALLVDHYDQDWSRLWWVRADGTATVVDEPQPDHPGLRHLVGRHPQYGTQPPRGPLVEIRVDGWRWWAAG